METLNDDTLREFMHTQKNEIADDGFSHRVMHNLPQAHRWSGRLFNIACTAACLLLFYLLNGFELLLETLEGSFQAFADNLLTNTNLLTLATALGILTAIGIGTACSMEE